MYLLRRRVIRRISGSLGVDESDGSLSPRARIFHGRGLSIANNVHMRCVSKNAAEAMSIRHQTLPSIVECVTPDTLPFESPLFGCNLDRDTWSFNSIGSLKKLQFDLSWERFLHGFETPELAAPSAKDVDEGPSESPMFAGKIPQQSAEEPIEPALFMPSNEEDVGIVTTIPAISLKPEDDTVEKRPRRESSPKINEIEPKPTTVEKLVPEIEVEEELVEEVLAQTNTRKDAGQKKEKIKSSRLPQFSRKTVPVIETDDEMASPKDGLATALPFSMTKLPTKTEIPRDDVSMRNHVFLSIKQKRRHQEPQAENKNENDSSSSGGTSSFKNRLRWRTGSLPGHPPAKPPIRRKQASMASLSDTVRLSKPDSVRKVAGVRDGSKKRKEQADRWIRV